MIRTLALLFTLLLPAITQAQEVDCADVEGWRDQPGIDLSRRYPSDLLIAAIIAEDVNFHDRFHAASSITADLARSASMPTAGNWNRKTVETCLTLKLANEFDADEVLTLWLQLRHFGRRCFGVDAAMQTLIGKPVADGTLADFLTLTTLLRSPSRYLNDGDLYEDRFRFVVDQGIEHGFLDGTLGTALAEQGPSPIIDAECAA